MAVYVGRPKYENPPVGLHPAVCCDVIDLGLQDTPFGKKHKVALRWQIAEKKSDGKRFVVRKSFSASLDKRATLRKDLESWRGKSFSNAEAEKLDLEVLLGKPCTLQLVEAPGRDGTVYVNVATVMPLAKGFEVLTVDGDYVREQDRPADGSGADTGEAPPEDSEVPF